MKPWQCIFVLSGCLQGGVEHLEGEWYAPLKCDAYDDEVVTFGPGDEYRVSQTCRGAVSALTGTYSVDGEVITVCWLDQPEMCYPMRWSFGTPGTLRLERNPDTVLLQRNDKVLLLQRRRP